MSKGFNQLYVVIAAGAMVSGLSGPVFAGLSGPGGPRFNYDNPPKIAPYERPSKQRTLPGPRKRLQYGVPGFEPTPRTGTKRSLRKGGRERLRRPAERSNKFKRHTQKPPSLARPPVPPLNQGAQPWVTSPDTKGAAGRAAPDIQRRQLLTKFYGLLAQAKNQGQAAQIAQSIEQLWLHSGSPTTDLLMKRADRAIETGRWASAETFADTVVKLQPNFTEGLMRRAMINAQRGRLQSALRDLRRVLAIEPSHFVALDRMAAILDSMGSAKASLTAYQQLKRVYPHAPGLAVRIEELTRKVEGEPI